jgi:NADH dehydrogenase [ubiquinone] 1 alpha subcomplex assembly factor 5
LVYDSGGGRGYLSKNILAETVEDLKVYDISETMLKQAEGTPGVNVSKQLLETEYLDVSNSIKYSYLSKD